MDEKQPGTLRILTEHFFRRFFDNDTVQPEGDTVTTVVRAIAFAAAPGLMIAFFMQTHIHQIGIWAELCLRCFFVVYSFVVMGGVAVFEWEMLFPDKMDFLVLTPLPIPRRDMFAAKAGALAAFLGLFVLAANIFSTVLLSGGLPRVTLAHVAATVGAGLFAALLILAIGGVLLCVVSGRVFRILSPLLQMMAVMTLLLVLIAYLRFTGSIPVLLQQQPMGVARWLPPLWFLGLYEEVLLGSKAPAFAVVMARFALWGLAVMAGVVMITYPLAWARVRKMTIEGITRGRGKRSRGMEWLATTLVRSPGERAIFHFIGQTMARNNRYQVYLAIYCGAGLAVAVSCVMSLRVVGGAVRLGVSDYGLHAVMPMLVFWTVAGLRTAFAFPVNLQAGWIFRVTGVDLSECAAAARRWVTACAVGVLGGVLAAQAVAGWDLRKLLVQAVCGVCLCLLLSDGFFFAQRSVPFNQPRMPGNVSFPLMLTLYIGVYPLLVVGMGRMEAWLERHTQHLATVCFVAAVLHLAAFALRGLSKEAEDLAEYDGEFQVLGLTTQ